MDLNAFPWISMYLKGSRARVSDPLWQPETPCGCGLDSPNIKISDSGGLDMESCSLDLWMLTGLERIEVTEVTAGWEQLEEILTRSSFRSSADLG